MSLCILFFRFGAYMPELIKAIEKNFTERKFRKKPLGPIGNY